jgi:hypothetical protein
VDVGRAVQEQIVQLLVGEMLLDIPGDHQRN